MVSQANPSARRRHKHASVNSGADGRIAAEPRHRLAGLENVRPRPLPSLAQQHHQPRYAPCPHLPRSQLAATPYRRRSNLSNAAKIGASAIRPTHTVLLIQGQATRPGNPITTRPRFLFVHTRLQRTWFMAIGNWQLITDALQPCSSPSSRLNRLQFKDLTDPTPPHILYH